MTVVFLPDMVELYNSSRGGVFFWVIMILFTLAWAILMFVKGKLVSTNEQVYKSNPKKEEPTNDQINDPSGDKQSQKFEKSEYDPDDKGSQVKKSDLSESAPRSVQKPAQQEGDQRPALDKALAGFQQFLFLYAPLFVIHILNLICYRSWAFCLTVWFLIMIPIVVVNLLGLGNTLENRFIKCLLRSIWIFVGVCWYINFYSIMSPVVVF